MQDKDIIQDLKPYESDITDILGGKTYREYQTGVKLDDNYIKTPGMNQVEGADNQEHTITYPLLLTTFRTTEIMDKIKEVLELGEVENSDLFNKLDGKYTIKVDILKSWEDGNATFIGTGILTHDRWLKLERMGIRPLLYLEKGTYYKSKSGVLFDFTKYKPLILEKEDGGQITETVQSKKVKSLDDLSWDNIKSNPNLNKLEDNDTNESKIIENTNEKDECIDVPKSENIDKIKSEIDMIANNLMKDEKIELGNLKGDAKEEESYESLIPDVDFGWD